jgi:murein DD-endopeptidase MepM/ murein hydrolase activator NlpD
VARTPHLAETVLPDLFAVRLLVLSLVFLPLLLMHKAPQSHGHEGLRHGSRASTQKPVALGNLGSAFGWRVDPITGQSALHTGLDFQADPGTPIR